ncbi:MAG: glycosyltransferase family 2 protein [Nitrospirae bacterium]|nr:glycosyltransferase family 2 protein [Nitrospirota bacterium]
MDLKISVVIATKGRPDSLQECLRSISEQEIAVTEVIIVDQTPQPIDQSTLQSVLGVSSASPRLIYHWNPAITGLPQARNVGVRLSSGDFIQFIDDDAALDNEYFVHLLPVFSDPIVGGGTGLIIEMGREKRRLLRDFFFRLFYLGPFREDRTEVLLSPPSSRVAMHTLSGCGLYRHQVFDEFKFDETLIGHAVGEDLDFSYRVSQKWRLILEPRALLYHYRLPGPWRNQRQSVSQKVLFYHYHFCKNMRGTFAEWLSFFWLNFGFLLDACTYLNLEVIAGVFVGWRQILERGIGFHPD